MRPITPTDLIKALEIDAEAGVPSMIWGPPGIGKSDLVRQLATKLGADLYDLRANLFDPIDVRGGIKMVEDPDQAGKFLTKYGVPSSYPPSNHKGKVVLFIDELPAASKATMNAFLQLLLDRRIDEYELPEDTVIIAAGNRAEDRAAVNAMPTPVKNRFAHYTLEANINDWVDWAIETGVDSRIIAFLRFKTDMLHNMDPKSNENAFPTPRSWAMLDQKIAAHPAAIDDQFAIASVVGDGAMGEFSNFVNVISEMPDIDQLLANPTKAAVSDNPSILFAVSTSLAARANSETVAAIVKYINRIPAEYQVVTVRDMLKRDRALLTHAPIQEWHGKNSSMLMGE